MFPETLFGTARLGRDHGYLSAEGYVVWPRGETQLDLTLTILDDAEVEPVETILLDIFRVSEALPNSSTGWEISRFNLISIESDERVQASFGRPDSVTLEEPGTGEEAVEVSFNVEFDPAVFAGGRTMAVALAFWCDYRRCRIEQR